MPRTKQRSIDDYISRIEAHLLKKFPDLTFDVKKRSDRQATIFYRPYSEDTDWPIIVRASNISTDALVDGGYRIHITPAE